MIQAAKPIVLLVEDEPFVAMVACQILEDEGYRVSVAGTASSALALIREDDCEAAAALVDLGLPDMCGDVLIVQLRQINPHLPVVITSGYGAEELRARFAGLSDIAIIVKPYDSNSLLGALRDLGVARPEPLLEH